MTKAAPSPGPLPPGIALDSLVPGQALGGLVKNTWLSRPRSIETYALPDGLVDLVWSETAGVRLSGPYRARWSVPAEPGMRVGVTLRAGVAHRLFGLPTSCHADQAVLLDEAIGSGAARSMWEQIGEASDRRRALLSVVASRLERVECGGEPAPGLIAEALSSGRSGGVGAVADRLGWSTRQLQRRCHDAYGLSPSELVRIGRFRRFLAHAQHGPGQTLASMSALAGYADQSHLARDCRTLAAAKPSSIVATYRPAYAAESPAD